MKYYVRYFWAWGTIDGIERDRDAMIVSADRPKSGPVSKKKAKKLAKSLIKKYGTKIENVHLVIGEPNWATRKPIGKQWLEKKP